MTGAELRRLAELCTALRAVVDELVAIIGAELLKQSVLSDEVLGGTVGTAIGPRSENHSPDGAFRPAQSRSSGMAEGSDSLAAYRRRHTSERYPSGAVPPSAGASGASSACSRDDTGGTSAGRVDAAPVGSGCKADPSPASIADVKRETRERIGTEADPVERLNTRLRAAFVADPLAPVAPCGPRFGDLAPPRLRRPPSGLPRPPRPAGERAAIEAHIAAKGVTICPAPLAVETPLEFNPVSRKWRRPTS